MLGLLALACTDGRKEPAREAEPGPGAKPAARPDGLPPTARPELLEELRRANEARRDPADGAGRAWLELAEGEEPVVRVGDVGRWTIVFEAGPEGIAEGGGVRLIGAPFWGWSGPQSVDPQAPGYTTAETEAEGVELELQTLSWLHIGIAGRALREGERVRIVYGAGPAGARADTYAERESRLWIGVDGDGDGNHRVLADSPALEVRPGPPRQLRLTLPSTAHPGTTVPLRVALLDRMGNCGWPFVGEVELLSANETVDLPERVAFTAGDAGRRTVQVSVQAAGVARLVGRVVVTAGEADAAANGRELIAESNPLLVERDSPRILWADIHGHSNLSDGTGTPEDFLTYARDVSGLDVVALTDHDHWGLLALDEYAEPWARIGRAARDFHDPGRFVTFLGYEWTSWIHGHRHVLFAADDAPLFSAIDPAYETPAQLWEGLRAAGVRALTFAHHSAGGPIATNWDFPPDPEFEPVTEVASVHGASEAPDAPNRIYSPLAGNFVRDVLDRGYRLGFVGSGDSHDGHPGLAQLASPSGGGLAAVLSEELTRDGVFAALHAHRVYATNGPRMVLRCALGGHRLGATVRAQELDPSTLLYVRVLTTAPLQRIDVIRSGQVVQTVPGEEAWDFTTAVELEDLKAGEYVYVRAVQAERGAAWSSPFYVE